MATGKPLKKVDDSAPAGASYAQANLQQLIDKFNALLKELRERGWMDR